MMSKLPTRECLMRSMKRGVGMKVVVWLALLFLVASLRSVVSWSRCYSIPTYTMIFSFDYCSTIVLFSRHATFGISKLSFSFDQGSFLAGNKTSDEMDRGALQTTVSLKRANVCTMSSSSWDASLP